MHVQGQLSKFGGEMQIRVENAWMEMDPLAESLHWVRHRCQARASCAAAQGAEPRPPSSPRNGTHTFENLGGVAHFPARRVARSGPWMQARAVGATACRREGSVTNTPYGWSVLAAHLSQLPRNLPAVCALL